MVEILCAALTGAAMLSQVRSWNLDMAASNRVGHAFIAIDVGQMMPLEQFAVRMSALAEELHHAKRAQGIERIFLPGEMEWAKRKEACERGWLSVPYAMEDSLNKLAAMYSIKLDWLA